MKRLIPLLIIASGFQLYGVTVEPTAPEQIKHLSPEQCEKMYQSIDFLKNYFETEFPSALAGCKNQKLFTRSGYLITSQQPLLDQCNKILSRYSAMFPNEKHVNQETISQKTLEQTFRQFFFDAYRLYLDLSGIIKPIKPNLCHNNTAQTSTTVHRLELGLIETFNLLRSIENMKTI